MSKIKPSTFKQGYVVNKINNFSNNSNKDKNINFKELSYPNGIIPFIFLIILFAIGITVVMVVAYFKDPFFDKRWTNYLISVPGVTLCLNLLWLIARTGLFNSFGYMGLKFSRMTRFNRLKEKLHITPINASLTHIHQYSDYNTYVSNRQQHTKKFTIISLIVHSSLFVIALIIFLVVQYI